MERERHNLHVAFPLRRGPVPCPLGGGGGGGGLDNGKLRRVGR